MSDRSPPQALIVAVLGFGQMVAFASSFYLLGVLGDPMAEGLGLPPSLVFSLMSLALAVTFFTTPWAGRRTDAWGGKKMLLLSNLVFAGGLALLAAAQGTALLVAGMAVIGLAMSFGLYNTPFAMLVSLYGQDARRPITGVALIGGLGSAVGWPATALFADALGWRGACLAWAAIHLAVCLPLVAWLTPHVQGEGEAHEDPAAPHEPVVWDRPMIQMAVLFAGAWFLATSMSTHLPRLLEATGLTPAAAASTAGLVGVAAVTMRFLEFTVLKRLPPLLATRAAPLGHAGGALTLLGFGKLAAPLMAIGQGLGNGMLSVAKGVLPLHLYGPRNYGYRSALLTRPAQLAQIGGPALYGLALERSVALALCGSIAICLVMFVMTFGLRRTELRSAEMTA